MNYLPLILIAIVFLTNKEKDYKQILNNFSAEDINEILKLTGLDEQVCNSISQIIPSVLEDGIDFSKIIKNALPLLMNYFLSAKAESAQDDYQEVNNKFEFEEIAGEEISAKLKEYFL